MLKNIGGQNSLLFHNIILFLPVPVQKGPPFLFAMFSEEQTSHLVNLNVQMNRKNTNKKYVGPVQVQPISLSF